jgi:lipopolysaccharide export system permease protein
MLFDSSLRKELSRTFGATLVILITVVMSMLLIRTLGLAAGGTVNPQDVLMLLGYAVLGHLSTILTLSLFIAVTSTMGRMYRDSEMAIWFSSGRGLASFAWPVLRFAWPILATILLLALFVWPWSNQQSQQLRGLYQTRGDLDRVAPGQFQENASGTRVFFIERDEAQASSPQASSPPDSSTQATSSTATSSLTVSAASPDSADVNTAKSGRNIFMSSTEGGKNVVTSARNGRTEMIGENQFLILSNGQQLEQTNGQPGLKLSEFAEYGTQIGKAKVSSEETTEPKALRTVVLLRDPKPSYRAELGWRLGLVIAAVNLILLALVVSATNPRAGRGYSLAFALLAFVVYYNLLNIGYGWVGSGRVKFLPWMLGLHGGVFVLTTLWLTARHKQWSMRHLIPARK